MEDLQGHVTEEEEDACVWPNIFQREQIKLAVWAGDLKPLKHLSTHASVTAEPSKEAKEACASLINNYATLLAGL